jgi:hypothetical protein
VIGSVVSMIGQWGEVPGGALPIAMVVVGLTGRLDRASVWRAISALAAVAALMILYVLAYVSTPLPLEWQIGTSLSRLVTHLWPALVWALFQLSGRRIASRHADARTLDVVAEGV